MGLRQEIDMLQKTDFPLKTTFTTSKFDFFFSFIFFGRLIGDQDLLRNYSDIIFQHRILVRPPE